MSKRKSDFNSMTRDQPNPSALLSESKITSIDKEKLPLDPSSSPLTLETAAQIAGTKGFDIHYYGGDVFSSALFQDKVYKTCWDRIEGGPNSVQIGNFTFDGDFTIRMEWDKSYIEVPIVNKQIRQLTDQVMKARELLFAHEETYDENQ